MPSYEPICTRCENYVGAFRCRAFPKGIPHHFLNEFLASSHTSVFPHQTGDAVFVEKRESE